MGTRYTESLGEWKMSLTMNPAQLPKTPFAAADGMPRAREIDRYAAAVRPAGVKKLRLVGRDLSGDSSETGKMFRRNELARGLSV